MPRIELTHVTKRWDKFYAVDDLDLVIEDNARAFLPPVLQGKQPVVTQGCQVRLNVGVGPEHTAFFMQGILL